MEENLGQEKYISLLEATKFCSYSEPYLRLRARAGKLKSIKLGKKWMTTCAWVNDYTSRAQEWNNKIAKKTKPNEPAFVAPPAILAQNIFAPKILETTGKEESQTPFAIPVPAKRLAALPPSAQLFPTPKPSIAKNEFEHNWFWPMVSGALCGLILFWTMISGTLLQINFDYLELAPANISQAIFDAKANLLDQIDRNNFSKTSEEKSFSDWQFDPLKNLVQWLANQQR